jgi:hypothetical protein
MKNENKKGCHYMTASSFIKNSLTYFLINREVNLVPSSEVRIIK